MVGRATFPKGSFRQKNPTPKKRKVEEKVEKVSDSVFDI